MTYKASLDKICIIITIAVFLIMIVLTAIAISDLAQIPLNSPQEKMAAAGISLTWLALLGAFLFRPLSYTLQSGTLIINRPLRSAVFPLSEITAAEIIHDKMMWRMVRIFGVGGFFGYFGKFWDSKHKFLTAYGTRGDHKILIHLRSGKKILITPDDIQLFDELQKHITR